MTTTQQIITKLQSSGLWAECTLCEGEFKLKDAILFDGTRPFPKEALEAQARLKAELKEREEELKKRKHLATDRAANTAKAVNLGKNIEKILPLMKDFKWSLADCRVMGDPIDLLTFNGYAVSAVESITFVEVKSGGARLNEHQKAIRDAVTDKKVSYKVFR